MEVVGPPAALNGRKTHRGTRHDWEKDGGFSATWGS